MGCRRQEKERKKGTAAKRTGPGQLRAFCSCCIASCAAIFLSLLNRQGPAPHQRKRDKSRPTRAESQVLATGAIEHESYVPMGTWGRARGGRRTDAGAAGNPNKMRRLQGRLHGVLIDDLDLDVGRLGCGGPLLRGRLLRGLFLQARLLLCLPSLARRLLLCRLLSCLSPRDRWTGVRAMSTRSDSW